mgnify:CR=1 FL=1
MLFNVESGRQVRVDTGNGRLRERFRQAAAAEREGLAAEFRAAAIQHTVLDTHLAAERFNDFWDD